jgi:TrmH family RNA methyltransferase
VITSLTSPKIVRVRRLLETHSAQDRIEAAHYVVEGSRAVEGVLSASEGALPEIYATAEWLDRFPTASEISEEVARKISDTVSPQGVFAVVPIPVRETDLSKLRTIALFLELQDPGNAGTVIRSAHGFGIDAVIFGKGSVDPYSGKVVRSSAGSIAAVPIHFGESPETVIASLQSSHQILAFDMEGEDLPEIEYRFPLLMIFGNEARGLPDSLRDPDSIKKVRIPMAHGIESLNVASAATVAMYEISRRDR